MSDVQQPEMHFSTSDATDVQQQRRIAQQRRDAIRHQAARDRRRAAAMRAKREESVSQPTLGVETSEAAEAWPEKPRHTAEDRVVLRPAKGKCPP